MSNEWGYNSITIDTQSYLEDYFKGQKFHVVVNDDCLRVSFWIKKTERQHHIAIHADWDFYHDGWLEKRQDFCDEIVLPTVKIEMGR